LDSAANRRCTKIVDRKFQFGIALRHMLVLAAVLLAGIVLSFAPSFYVLATTDDLKSLESASIEFLVLHERLWPGMLLSLAGIFGYSLYFSHRIVGPVFRINSILRALLEDRTPDVLKIREGDYLQETAALLERLAAKIVAPREENRQRSGDAPPPEGPK
jgi:hypothetical protein